MIKRILSIALVLILIAGLGLAENLKEYTWIFDGKVSAGAEHALHAPFAASIKTIYAKPNKVLKKGDKLLELELDTVYSPVNGTIGSILAGQGDSLAIIKELYKAAVAINGEIDSVVNGNHFRNAKDYEYSVAQLGETVYLQGRNDTTQVGEGVIIARDSKGFTVKITKGELRYNSRVYIYRSPKYEAKKRLGSGKVERKDPVLVNGEGYLVEMLVKQGQSVKAGDALFTYTKSVYRGESPIITMPENGILLKLEKKLGEAVDTDAPIATYMLNSEKFVTAKLNEIEINRIKLGDVYTARVVGSGVENIKCKVSNISAVPDDKGLYEVNLSSEDIEDLFIGTTLSFAVK